MASRVWVLLYSRSGDNSQALALANSLGLPFEEKRLRYNKLREIGPHLGPSLITLSPQSRHQLHAPWPEVVIAIGRWSVPVVRWIKAQSQGNTKIIFLGNPRVDPRYFDLVIATVDYLGPRGSNVAIARLPVAKVPQASSIRNATWIDELPTPHLLLLVGGPVKYWQLPTDRLHAALSHLIEKATAMNGSVIVSGSPRTPPTALAFLRQELAGVRNARLAPSLVGGLGDLLEAADEIVVTGDSMAMVAEAILTGKPVGILPLELSDFGWRKLGLEPARTELESNRRDLRRYWQDLWEQGLAGTIEEPRAVEVESSASSAARVAASYLRLDAANDLPPRSGTAALVVGEPGERWANIEPRLRNAPGTRSVQHVLAAPFIAMAARISAMVYRTSRDAGALALAARDPRIPWYVKLTAWVASLTAISPIDLTPDFIPVVGYLDDLALMALGTMVAVRLIPPPVWAELRARAAAGERLAAAGTAALFMVWLSAGTAAAARFL